MREHYNSHGVMILELPRATAEVPLRKPGHDETARIAQLDATNAKWDEYVQAQAERTRRRAVTPQPTNHKPQRRYT